MKREKTQRELLNLLRDNVDKIAEEYFSCPNKKLLNSTQWLDLCDKSPESEYSKQGQFHEKYVEGLWRAFPIFFYEREAQNYESFKTIYDILREFPYKSLVTFMEVHPGVSIKPHYDDEGAWTWHLCVSKDVSQSATIVEMEDNKKDVHYYEYGSEFTLEAYKYLHYGYNFGKTPRITLMVDYWDENEFDQKKYDEWVARTNRTFGGTNADDDLVEIERIYYEQATY